MEEISPRNSAEDSPRPKRYSKSNFEEASDADSVPASDLRPDVINEVGSFRSQSSHGEMSPDRRGGAGSSGEPWVGGGRANGRGDGSPGDLAGDMRALSLR